MAPWEHELSIVLNSQLYLTININGYFLCFFNIGESGFSGMLFIVQLFWAEVNIIHTYTHTHPGAISRDRYTLSMITTPLFMYCKQTEGMYWHSETRPPHGLLCNFLIISFAMNALATNNEWGYGGLKSTKGSIACTVKAEAVWGRHLINIGNGLITSALSHQERHWLARELHEQTVDRLPQSLMTQQNASRRTGPDCNSFCTICSITSTVNTFDVSFEL